RYSFGIGCSSSNRRVAVPRRSSNRPSANGSSAPPWQTRSSLRRTPAARTSSIVARTSEKLVAPAGLWTRWIPAGGSATDSVYHVTFPALARPGWRRCTHVPTSARHPARAGRRCPRRGPPHSRAGGAVHFRGMLQLSASRCLARAARARAAHPRRGGRRSLRARRLLGLARLEGSLLQPRLHRSAVGLRVPARPP